MKKANIFLSIYHKDGKVEAVEREAYILEKHGMVFGIHRPLRRKKGWSVTELRSGSSARINRRTLKECENAITENLVDSINNVASNDKFYKKIEKMVKKAYHDAGNPLYYPIYHISEAGGLK